MSQGTYLQPLRLSSMLEAQFQGSNRFEGKSWWPSQAVWQRRRRIRLDTDEASSTMKFVRF